MPIGVELTLGAILDPDDAVAVVAVVAVVPVGPGAAVVADCGAAEVVQCAVGGGPVLMVLAGWLLVVAVAVAVAVAVLVELALEVAVSLGLGLELSEAVSLGLGLPLSLALVPVLAGLLVLASLPLDEVAGAVADVDVVAGAGVLALPEALAGADAAVLVGPHGVAWPLGAMPAMLLPDGTGACEAPDVVVDASLPELDVPVMSALIVEPMLANSCRVVGTTASTKPSTNTAMPVAKAGRSIASRQSRRWPGSRGGNVSRIRSVSEPAQPRTASHTAIAPCRWRPCPDRDRIFSRIWSRPSAPGCIWSAAACSSRRR